MIFMVYNGDEQYYRVSLRKYEKHKHGSRLSSMVDICCEDYGTFCKIVEAVKEIIGDDTDE